MPGRGEIAAPTRTDEPAARAISYCVIPSDLAGKLHEPLRRYFRDDPAVVVVVEHRTRDRRVAGDRRVAAAALRPGGAPADRRRIRAANGRRIADRRTAIVPVDPPGLPRAALRYADRLEFVQRLEPSAEELEDRDTAAVVGRFQAGDESAFAVLYMRYFDRVYQYLRVALGEDHEAEDATQQVFLSVLAALPRYERRGNRPFRAWLFTIVRNHAINQLRVARRTEPVEPERLDRRRDAMSEADIDLSALEWVSDRELVMFLERLPAVQQQVLLLRFQLQLKTSEIAEILGRSTDDVRGLQSRALRFLAERLTALGRGPARPTGRVRAKVFPKYAPVLRGRRFVLH